MPTRGPDAPDGPEGDAVRRPRDSTNTRSLYLEDTTASLTPRQQATLEYVADHTAKHGYPPTVREIGQAVGLASSSTVHAHLNNLQRLGHLRRDPTKPRALGLVARDGGGVDGDR